MPQLSAWVNGAAKLQISCKTRSNRSLSENLAECRDRLKRPRLLKKGPLHAHDEMIYAEQCAIALYFVLHKRFVPDNETVLDEFFERLRERFCALRLLIEPPGRIGRVFILERGLAFF